MQEISVILHDYVCQVNSNFISMNWTMGRNNGMLHNFPSEIEWDMGLMFVVYFSVNYVLLEQEVIFFSNTWMLSYVHLFRNMF